MELNAGIPIGMMNVDMLLRLGVASLLGLILGIDRELRGIPAGLRTHGLVCLSAAAMTICVIALYNQLGGPGSDLDPLRLVEGVGTFVGIIAASLIVIRKGDVHNLTTAVHFWLAAVIGIACGAGQWPLVCIAMIHAIVLMSLVRLIEKRWIVPVAGDRQETE